METTSSLRRRIIVASLVAGPVFVTATSLASAYKMLPRPIVIETEHFAMMGWMLLMAVIFGPFLGFIPNLIGAAAMRSIANAVPSARAPGVWVAVGAASGFALAKAFEVDGTELAFSLVVTSAICAWICRRRLRWCDE